MMTRAVVAVVFGAVMLTTDVSSAQRTTSGPQASGESIPLEDRLMELGHKYDCYFTVEEGWQEAEAVNAFSTALVGRPAETGTLQQALDQIAKYVPSLRFELRQQKDRPIVHVIDKRLDGQGGYALARVIESYEFSGTTGGLVADLGKRGIAISSQTVFAIGRPLAFDRDTRVTVKAAGLTVRRILSDGIPLKGYSRVIWTAATKLSAGAGTVVTFKGARS